MHHVRLFFDVAEVLGLGAFIAETFLVAVEHDIVLADAAGDVLFPGDIDRLRNVVRKNQRDRSLICALHGIKRPVPQILQAAGEFEGGLLAHAVGDHVGP